MGKAELSDLMREVGGKFYPRRYRRFKDLRSYNEAWEWVQQLDWRQNPYDRFLLRRELFRYLESTQFYKGRRNVFTFASRAEIAAEIDQLLDEFPDKYRPLGVFGYVLIVLPWRLGFRHGRVQHSRLTQALATLP